MAKRKKYYVVWVGNATGVFDTWNACQSAVQGVPGAKFKSFDSRIEAEAALAGDPRDFIGTQAAKPKTTGRKLVSQSDLSEGPIMNSISVDAAASGNPGLMEYQGVETATGEQLFHQGPFAEGTNNIGEFLALVHGLAYLKQKNDNRPIYTDSKVAILWIKQKVCKTKLAQTQANKRLFELIRRAEKWLRENSFDTPIIKWETKQWGEIPADFGRK